MSMTVICQALPISRPTPSKGAPVQTGPLTRPHGFSQARRTIPYAFNPALDSFGDGMGVPAAPFVRPDCPPDLEDMPTSSKNAARTSTQPQSSRPQFRSALEQVSYMTNSKLWSNEDGKQGGQKFQSPLRFLGL